jgi:hypothetical protein
MCILFAIQRLVLELNRHPIKRAPNGSFSWADRQPPNDKLTNYLFDTNILNLTFNLADKAQLYSTFN